MWMRECCLRQVHGIFPKVLRPSSSGRIFVMSIKYSTFILHICLSFFTKLRLPQNKSLVICTKLASLVPNWPGATIFSSLR
ncbi:hypothetical protein BpHYR1_030880 [Brachionus plicatilis]|uniref:Uncharacterized protein n=1 Tax=Brachionus plicatilis TaxID=10195 RepID=A0A3M7QJ80_BRAPC|nr:hypothetical protein BpHYR1_030880 [Brachionus plicatilis]